ncbi:MAG: glutaredoxin family protein, partial [Thermoanaerobaculia bacterium]|nr:glutaredoxin family protein [Thermoanaerobaculia bacterium]
HQPGGLRRHQQAAGDHRVGMSRAGRPRLVVLSRPSCHLCDEMCAVLDRHLPRWELEYEVVDVDSDSELRRRYGMVIPVLLWNGHEVARIRLSSRRLEAIARRRTGGEVPD